MENQTNPECVLCPRLTLQRLTRHPLIIMKERTCCTSRCSPEAAAAPGNRPRRSSCACISGGGKSSVNMRSLASRALFIQEL